MYLIKYSGTFGYIKPWTAAADSKTKSMDFLTPSILMGIERKLFNELDINNLKIKRYRLNFDSISFQQESTLSQTYQKKQVKGVKKSTYYAKNPSIVSRGILINPTLFMAFDNLKSAEEAIPQHICLCRNEDILLTDGNIIEITEKDFDSYSGYESFSTDSENVDGIYCGLNKYTNDKQFVVRKIFNNPSNLF